MKIALNAYEPSFILFARMTLAALCFLCGWNALRFPSNGRDWARLLLMTACEPCLYLLCEGHALVYTTASQAGVITAMLPILVAVAAHKKVMGRQSCQTP